MTATLRTLAITWIVLQAAVAGAQEPPPGRKPAGKLTFHQAPSEEKPAAREKRLRRECKGRPNAGACLGFTSP